MHQTGYNTCVQEMQQFHLPSAYMIKNPSPVTESTDFVFTQLTWQNSIQKIQHMSHVLNNYSYSIHITKSHWSCILAISFRFLLFRCLYSHITFIILVSYSSVRF
uniref:Uncharacterized protein n=1 Tax=Rhizophora mucronata TaxID=61149 RepID=A0A2P2QEM7_RHIMU